LNSLGVYLACFVNFYMDNFVFKTVNCYTHNMISCGCAEFGSCNFELLSDCGIVGVKKKQTCFVKNAADLVWYFSSAVVVGLPTYE